MTLKRRWGDFFLPYAVGTKSDFVLAWVKRYSNSESATIPRLSSVLQFIRQFPCVFLCYFSLFQSTSLCFRRMGDVYYTLNASLEETRSYFSRMLTPPACQQSGLRVRQAWACFFGGAEQWGPVYRNIARWIDRPTDTHTTENIALTTLLVDSKYYIKKWEDNRNYKMRSLSWADYFSNCLHY